MAPFYPYIPIPFNTTMPCTYFNTTTIIQATQATLTANMAEQNAAGTSLATVDVIGITAGVLVLFIGLGWFAYYMLAVLPQRKKVSVRERWERRNYAGHV
jgi:hypothetical protein